MSARLAVFLVLLLGVAFARPTAAHADYDPPALHQLFVKAEVLARGRIVELSRATYLLEVDECLLGDINRGKRIELARFQDWPCAQRMTPYRVGQNVLVFAESHGGKLRPIGAGNEGEFLLAGETLYCRYANLLENAEPDPQYGAYTYPYDAMRALLLGYRKCFEFVPGTGPDRPGRIRPLVGNPSLMAFSRKSTVHASLVSATREEMARQRQSILTK